MIATRKKTTPSRPCKNTVSTVIKPVQVDK